MVANASSQGGKQLYHYLASFPGGLGMRLTTVLQLAGIVFSIESSVSICNQPVPGLLKISLWREKNISTSCSALIFQFVKMLQALVGSHNLSDLG